MDFRKLPDVDLHLLVIFDEIRKQRSLTLAAESLGVTQSAINKSLRQLHHQLDNTIFVRSSKRMQATTLASEFGLRYRPCPSCFGRSSSSSTGTSPSRTIPQVA